MKVLDLFSGIGGFSIGLEKAGFETVAFCEIEDYPRAVLRRHWPDIPIYRDVKQLTGEQLRADGIIPDVIVGEYPCQPFSLAGVRRGEEDDRHLWPEVRRLVKEIRPAWCIFENVAGHITMGLDKVLSDLEAEDYSTRTFIIPAAGVDAPHRRDRVWIVANTRHQPRRNSISGSVRGNGAGQYAERKRSNEAAEIARPSETPKTLADTNSKRPQGEWAKRHDVESFGLCSGETPRQANFWPTEPDVGRVADGVSNRSHRIKALGNAVVPQIPEIIGRMIKIYQKSIDT